VDVVVDLGSGLVALEGWETVTALGIIVDGGPLGGPDESDDTDEIALSAALAEAGIGRDRATGAVLLLPAVLQALAADAAAADGYELDTGWDQGFADMLAYADTEGWIDDDGAVRAHVEWRDA
jgi:hypothetical protein